MRQLKRLDTLALEVLFCQGLECVKVRCRPNIRGQGIIGTCTIDPKTALVFGGFSRRQLITLSGEVRVDLVSVP